MCSKVNDCTIIKRWAIMKRNSDIFNQVIRFIVYHGKIIEKIFLVTTSLCAVCFPFVGVNYDLSKYLPDFAPTKQALDVMEAEFGYPGMARVMVKDVSLQEAKRIREEISAVDGVDLVLGSDVSTDVYMGTPFLSESMTEFIGVDLLAIDDYYKDGNALMDLVFEDKPMRPSRKSTGSSVRTGDAFPEAPYPARNGRLRSQERSPWRLPCQS